MTALCRVLELVRDGELVLPMNVVAGLGDALDAVLEARAEEARSA